MYIQKKCDINIKNKAYNKKKGGIFVEENVIEKEQKKILIVDDEQHIIDILVYNLKKEGYDTIEANDGLEAVNKALTEKPDLILLDIMLPDTDGISILKKLKEQDRTGNLPVIMVTAKTAEVDKVRGLDSGADDYMTKPFGVMELLSRVKAVLRRTGGDKNESVLCIGNVVLDSARRSVKVQEVPCELTYKEFELLKLLMTNVGIVVSRQVILDKIWGTNFEGESRSLDMHIKTLRQKLKEEGGLIKTIRNVGYIMSPSID